MENKSQGKQRGPYKKYVTDPKLSIPRSTTRSRTAKQNEEDFEVNLVSHDTDSSDYGISDDGNIQNIRDTKQNKKRKRKVLRSDKSVSIDVPATSKLSNSASQPEIHESQMDCYGFDSNSDNDDIEVDYNIDTAYSSESENDMDIVSDEDSNLDYSDISEGVDNDYLSDDDYSESVQHASFDEKTDSVLYEGCRITEQQSKLITMALSLRHNLPDVGLENFISVLDCHLPEDKLLSKYQLTKSIPVPDYTEYYYCGTCSEILSFDEQQNGFCRFCNTVYNKLKLKKEGYFFIIFSIKQQLEEIINSDLYDQLRFSCEKSDVINGKIYKKLKNKGVIGSNDISLQFNVDGVSLSKSSKASLWPILVTVNELPYRTRKNNVLIGGLWYSHEKPNMNMYLKFFIKDLIALSEQGIMKKPSSEIEESILIKVHTILCTVDSVARAMVQNWKQFNGSYGCPYCLNKGERISVGRGFSRIYRYQDIRERSTNQYEKHIRIAVRSRRVIKGVKGPSIISSIPCMNVIYSCPPDYMHAVLLGAIKLFVKAWFDSKYKNKPFYLGLHLKEFTERLLKIQPPTEVTRIPRPITDNYKANEWKNFLYYSIPCLTGLMENRYLQHWSLLVFALSVLLQEKICNRDLKLAKRAVILFVKKIETLYGKEFLRFNVHLVLHLPKFVAMYGAVWAWSAFPFEGFNGVIRHLYFGTQYVSLQISKLYCRLRYIKNNAYIFNQPNVNPKLFNVFQNLMGQCTVNNSIAHGSDLRSFGQAITINLSTVERHTIEQLIGEKINCTCQGFDRFIYKHMLFHSLNYKRLQKRNNSVIISKQGSLIKIIRLLIITSEATRTIKHVIMGYKLEIQNDLLCKSEDREIDSKKYSYIARETKTIVSITVDSIMSKCIIISHPISDYKCVFPLFNKLETD